MSFQAYLGNGLNAVFSLGHGHAIAIAAIFKGKKE